VMVFPCITWVSYVPSRFEMSDDFLHIRFAFRGDHKIAWNDLKAWGDGSDLAFVLQFANHGTFQIALFAFPKGQRQHLIAFLRTRFAHCEGKVRTGMWGFR